MLPAPLPLRPLRRLASALGTPASNSRLDFLPATTPTPSSKHIIEVIGRIRSRVRGDDAGASRGRTPFTCRIDGSPYAATTTTTPKSKRRRAGAGVATERPVEVIGRIRKLVRCETAGDDARGRVMSSKRRPDDDSPYTIIATPKSKRRRAHVAERPVEVVGRIRNLTARASALEVQGGGTTVRVRHDGAGGGGSCLCNFTLDGVSASEEEGLEGFYGRFVCSRVEGVRTGAKCTVMV